MIHLYACNVQLVKIFCSLKGKLIKKQVETNSQEINNNKMRKNKGDNVENFPSGSGSENMVTETPSTPKPGTRKFNQLTPEDQETEQKRQCLEKSLKDLETFIQGCSNKLSADFDKTITRLHVRIQEDMATLNNKLDLLMNDQKKTEEELTQVGAKVLQLETENSERKHEITEHDIQINIIGQKLLDKQLTILNIAPAVKDETFFDQINEWSQNLAAKTQMTYNLTKKQGFATKTAHLQFNTLSGKLLFLKFIKSKQFVDGKFSPILNDDIFKLAESDANKVKELEFRSPMTKTNREIFNFARKARKENNQIIEGVFIGNGAINLKLKSSTPGKIDNIQINSIDQLIDILATKKMKIPKK